MKIDDAYTHLDVSATDRTPQAERAARGGDRAGGPAAAGDAVAVSGEARLRAEALTAAAAAPDIRPDAVARGRALLESGQLGGDPVALADRLIDALLEQPTPSMESDD